MQCVVKQVHTEDTVVHNSFSISRSV